VPLATALCKNLPTVNIHDSSVGQNPQGLQCRLKKNGMVHNKIQTNINSTKNFVLNNQPDALIIPILFCYKTLHVSGILSAHHHEFSTVHSALVSFVQVFDDRFQAESGWNYSSILTLLGRGHRKPS